MAMPYLYGTVVTLKIRDNTDFHLNTTGQNLLEARGNEPLLVPVMLLGSAPDQYTMVVTEFLALEIIHKLGCNTDFLLFFFVLTMIMMNFHFLESISFLKNFQHRLGWNLS
jgi:hypothetical protein